MNAFNRLVMLIVALLLVAVPTLLLLVNFGALSADLIDQYTGYRSGLTALGGLVRADLTATVVRGSIAAAGALVALIALLLLLRELTFGRRVASSTVIDDSPGAETAVTAKAVRALAEGAAREAGAISPHASLTSHGRPYLVECWIEAPPRSDYTELATRARENVLRVLRSQSIPVKDVQVIVQGTAS